MDSTLGSQCPFKRAEYVINFEPLSRETIFQKTTSEIREFLARLSLASFKNAWRIGSLNDLSKPFALAWKEGSFITQCPTPAGTIYLTADQALMRAILQNHRKDAEGIFFDHKNKEVFIKGILQDLFPEEVKHFGIDKAADMVVLTASSPFIKSLRAPLVSMLSANYVKDFIPQMNTIADEILNSLSNQEKENCNAEQLAFEFAVTVISKFVTGYETTRANYQALAHAANAFSKRMTRIVSHRPALKIEEEEYQVALKVMREVIESNVHSNSSPFVTKLKELSWNDFQIRFNLYFMYFAASETTASSINYLLWQLGRPENKQYVNKIKDPELGESFLQKVVAETLRLHPPSFVEGRQLRCNTKLEIKDTKGQTIEKMKLRRGNIILCLSQVAALDPNQYEHPTQFNPERFDKVPSQLPWYPFGTGSHVCPGQYLAHAELKVLVSRLLNKFSIETLFPKEQTQQSGFFALRATAAQMRLVVFPQ